MSDRVAAESSFRDALSLAQRQGAKLFELRAALDLASSGATKARCSKRANF
jgi:hypothetical protein